MAVVLPSLEKQAIEDGNQTRVETWKYISKNSLMYVPDGEYWLSVAISING